jgi:acyl-CoA reductase-like NAD-dependent aldehyde dehydrogenase
LWTELHSIIEIYYYKESGNEFIKEFVQKTEQLKVGDPLSDDTDIGPVVNAKSLENMEGIVNRTLKEGAEILIGRKNQK